jgi:hypothetical protein
MKRFLVSTGVVCLLLMAPLTGPIQSEEVGKSPEWMDLDGDGLNDNAKDHNMDGIPDFDGGKANAATLAAASGIFADLKPAVSTAPASTEPCSLVFSRLTKLTLAQCLTRCDLEQSFGGSAGMSNNAAGGGACAGGVCLR